MTRISNRLKFHESDSKLVVALNARDLVNYLIEYRKEYLTNSDELVSEKAIISSVTGIANHIASPPAITGKSIISAPLIISPLNTDTQNAALLFITDWK